MKNNPWSQQEPLCMLSEQVSSETNRRHRLFVEPWFVHFIENVIISEVMIIL